MCVLETIAEALGVRRKPRLSDDEVDALLDAELMERGESPRRCCHCCRGKFRPVDGGWLFKALCGTCEINRIEELIIDLIEAEGDREVRQALLALKRLRELV